MIVQLKRLEGREAGAAAVISMESKEPLVRAPAPQRTWASRHAGSNLPSREESLLVGRAGIEPAAT
ncbi:MAG: hypothetical protein GKR94_28725 [Gammaproteobacteria bacterium]|nr:hypothetical protein [Gammaproteobacteria bacterium]